MSYLDYDDLVVVRKVCKNLNNINLIKKHCLIFYSINKVCKKWNFIVCKLVESRVVWIKKYDDNTTHLKITNFNQAFNNNTHCLSSNSLLKFRLNKELHCRIRQLITYDPFVLIDLQLPCLIHLEIKKCGYSLKAKSNVQDTINLKFKNLKRLILNLRNRIKFQIESPELFLLKTTLDLKLVQVDFKTIKLLDCAQLSTSMLQYKNLLYLIVQNYGSEKFNYNLLEKFKKLKEIYLSEINIKLFTRLMGQRRELNSNIKIYLNSIDVDMNEFNYARVYNLIYGLNVKDYAFYQENVNHLKGELTQSFFSINDTLNVNTNCFSRLVNVRMLFVNSHRISLNNWIKLLKSLKLEVIDISVNLNQIYLDQIAKCSPNLKSIAIKNYENLNFLFNLKSLESIRLQEVVSIDLFKQFINSFQFIKLISIGCLYQFKIDKHLIALKHEDKIIFKESRSIFLNYIISQVDSWTALFAMNGNAICEVDLD